ncbi:pseudaminic acid synthase [Portibacter lacus]|uniref:Pseudaminic acid synthase n=1 Tax=Portibacter lacus TaxID=1099794 RepID=A0AA37SSC7_9BACT|nr:pseudaminic acid synthase [Portibacter lacus]GLR18850.1 pseudaminic acid synthase [Portibacter lacus]
MSFKIGSTIIGNNEKPFIIAELSGNHNQSLERALELVRLAAASGAHAIKLQTYTADTITMNVRGGLFDINDSNSLWKGYNLYDLYKEAHTPWEWHKEIFDLANSLGMQAFSSPFDETAVDFLEELNVPAYKIASFESNHFPLLKKVAQTGKLILISSGTSKINELYESVQYLKDNGASDIIIFKCTSTYPASAADTNVNTIPVLQKIFPDCVIGLSDHTMGIGASIAAIAMGARVIEKHFTILRSEGGVDSAFSLEPQELKLLTHESEQAFLSLGKIQLNTQKSEEKSLQFKRSIYAQDEIKEGDIFSAENIKVIRPGDGLHPRFYDNIIGTKSKRNLKKGDPIRISDL